MILVDIFIAQMIFYTLLKCAVHVHCLKGFTKYVHCLIYSAQCFHHLTLLMLNTTCHVLANNVDPDQLASEEAN